MRRILVLLAAVAALVAGAVVVRSYGPASESDYRVAAIFDTAKGTIPGQFVRIAGATVGEIEDVELTSGYHARVEMSIDERFAPFRSDATCSIQPTGLISETFVQCDPGSPSGELLQPRGDESPTVPLRRTSAPVDISDLFEIWSVPTRQRFSLLLTTLGAGLAARGEDLNQVLVRANPTLALTRRALRIINEDRRRVGDIADAADSVFSELARRDDRVGAFIGRAARVTRRTAREHTALSESVRRLPPLLKAARPALVRVDELARDGAPILADLRRAAPDLNRLIGDAEPFATAARPVVRRLSTASRRGLRAARSAGPLVGDLRGFAHRAKPAGRLVDEFFVSLRDRGFVERLLDFTYNLAAASARFDNTSHILPGLLNITVSSCTLPAPKRTELCNAGWASDVSAGGAPAPRASFAPEWQPSGREDPVAPASEPANPVQDLLNFVFR